MTRQLESCEAEESVLNCQNTILSNVSDRLYARAMTNAAGGVGVAGIEWTPAGTVAPMAEQRLLAHRSDRRLQTSRTRRVERGAVSIDRMKGMIEIYGREMLTVFYYSWGLLLLYSRRHSS